MEEIWKDIEGFEGLYQVSNLGRVRSIDRVLTIYRNGKYYNRIQNGAIIAIQKGTGGYNIVQLHKGTNKDVHTYSVYRLVAKAFIPNPDNKPCVDHISTVRTDDRVCNLRWVSYKENANNPISIEHYIKGNSTPHSDRKKILQYTKDGKFVKQWDSVEEAADFIGITTGGIYGVANHRKHYNTAGGYVWKYA